MGPITLKYPALDRHLLDLSAVASRSRLAQSLRHVAVESPAPLARAVGAPLGIATAGDRGQLIVRELFGSPVWCEILKLHLLNQATELTSFWCGDILLPIDPQASLVMETVIFARSGQLRRR